VAQAGTTAKVEGMREHWSVPWYDVSLVALDPGHATMAMPVLPCHQLPDGRASRSVSVHLADVALALAVMSTTTAPGFASTVSLSVDHLDDLVLGSQLTLTCAAAPGRPGSPQQAHGRVVDDAGRLVATVAGWFLVQPATGPVGTQDRTTRNSDGLHDLIGLINAVDVVSGPERTDLSLQVVPRLWNHSQDLQGGIAGVASLAAAELSVGPDQQLLSTLLSYERPAPGEGTVPVTASVVRRGRRTGLVETTVPSRDGRTALSGKVVTGVT
jgi:acyl-coenzyme A thioesterase PaaI-like protein